MSKILLILSVFALIAFTSIALAQDAVPKTGVLTGDKIRVRTGPGTNHKILVELRKGAKVSVITEKGDWYEIKMPPEVILWISKNYVKEVRQGDALAGEVTGEKVNVRTGTEAVDVVVGQVAKGDVIRIVGTKAGWYKIRPPEGFTAFMYAKYVKLEGGTAPEVSPVEPAGNGQVEGDKYRQRLEKLNKQIEALTKEAKELERLLEEKREKENKLEEKLRQAEETIKGYEDDVKELERQAEEAREQLRTGVKQKARYTAEGYVDDIGVLFNPPPATHRLFVTGGGEPRYYLKSADASIDLDNYLRKRVGVEGKIVKEKWGDKEIEVIKIERIAILED